MMLEDEGASWGVTRQAVLAGYHGDESTVRALLPHSDPRVRAAALSALARMGRLGDEELVAALDDPSARVRRRACELAARRAGVDLMARLVDQDPTVVEAAAWALGEQGSAAAQAVPALAQVASTHDDPLCREAAVAALGAIGDERGLPAILAATRDRAPVRRRAVIALAPFSGPPVEEALRRALSDKDWQVRQAAEDLLPEPE
jgi:HEAT repeat protein